MLILSRILQQLYFRTNIGCEESLSDLVMKSHKPLFSLNYLINALACSDSVIYYSDINQAQNPNIGHLTISSQGIISDKKNKIEKGLISKTKDIVCELGYSIDVWKSYFSSIRESFIIRVGHVYNQIYYSSVSQVVTGLTLGREGVTSKSNSHLYEITGTYHLMAISGFHLSFFLGYVSKFYARYLTRKTTNVLNILFSYLFICLVGFSPGLNRAFLMFVISSLGFQTYRQKRSIYLLLFVLLFSLMIDIQDLFTVGFQLSYAASFGILSFNSLFKGYFSSLESIISGSPRVITNLSSNLIDSILISFSAQLMIFPLVIYHFGTFSIVGLFATSFVIWLIPIIMKYSYLLIGVSFLISIKYLLIFSMPLFFVIKIFLSILNLLSFNWSIISFENIDLKFILYYYLLISLTYGLIIMIKLMISRKNHAQIYRISI